MKFIYHNKTSKIKFKQKIICIILNNKHTWNDWRTKTWNDLSSKTWAEVFEEWNIEE